jgi:hypothetical protein
MEDTDKRLAPTTRIAWCIGDLLLSFLLLSFLREVIELPIHLAGLIMLLIGTLVLYPVARGFPNRFMKDERPFTFFAWTILSLTLSLGITALIWFLTNASD